MPSRSQTFHLQVPEECLPKLSESSPDLEPPDTLKRISSPSGTFPFLEPTHAHIHVDHQKLEWTSRDHRKGRHPIEQGKRRKISTFLRIEYWNISWWVACVLPLVPGDAHTKLFTVGSAVWVINGFFVFLPSENEMTPNLEAEGWSAFVGGTLFEIGGYFMVLESLNRKNVLCFGDAVHDMISQCTHHYHVRGASRSLEDGGRKREQKWIWWGTRWNEIGFLGSAIQFVAATIFWISTMTGIPGAINMNNVGLVDGIFWAPQVIGGCGFIISSLMFLLETQPHWYHIRPFRSLGWHVGFWNLVGALGFTLCGAFGIDQSKEWAQFQSGLCTFWGGWAFLIGSVCQWIECLNR